MFSELSALYSHVQNLAYGSDFMPVHVSHIDMFFYDLLLVHNNNKII